MKLKIPVVLLAFALVGGAGSRAAAPVEEARTDINPALVYWQAFTQLPDLLPTDNQHLFNQIWQGRVFDAQFEEIVPRYDSAFRTLGRAARQRVACDWGYDYSLGPELELPSLAKAKTLAQVARLRARWHLEHGRPEAASAELTAAFVLARQLSRDGILISTLVQFAMESILESAVAENWFRFDAATLDRVLEGWAAAPARGQVGACVATERLAFRDWYLQKIEGYRRSAASESEALERARELLARTSGEDQKDLAERAVKAAGGTLDGLMRSLRDLDPYYEEATAVMALPYPEGLERLAEFEARVKGHPNPFVSEFFPLFRKCRVKELTAEVRLAMVRAAAEYRRQGQAGLERVPDPLTGKPFRYARFVAEGVDRGFELRSAIQVREFPEVQLFLERDGPAFRLEGPRVGEPMK